MKVLKDKEKVDKESGEALSSGLGFIEFESADVAKFAIRYLNNMELIKGKGMIVDYSLEDARALHKREKKLKV